MTKFDAKYYGAARHDGEDHDAVISCLLRGYGQKTDLTVDGSSQTFRGKNAIKSNPNTGLGRTRGFQEFEASRFQENRHTKVVRLSAPRTDLL